MRGPRGPWQGSFWFVPVIEKSCSSSGSALPAGRSALRHGHREAGATGLLQGGAGRGRGQGSRQGPVSGLLTPPFPTQGLFPAGIRLVPHTVLTFVFLEQLRKHFGTKVSP